MVNRRFRPVWVKAPRVRDRPEPLERLSLTSTILPRYWRRAKTIEALIPWLYLKAISTHDFGEALKALLGTDAPGLSPGTISRLREQWMGDYEVSRRRNPSGRRYLYCGPSMRGERLEKVEWSKAMRRSDRRRHIRRWNPKGQDGRLALSYTTYDNNSAPYPLIAFDKLVQMLFQLKLMSLTI